LRNEHDNRDIERRDVLLVRQIAICGEEGVELPDRQGEQLTVFAC
jgi:hypothetical protein